MDNQLEKVPAQYLDLEKFSNMLYLKRTSSEVVNAMNKLFRLNYSGMRNYVTVENDVRIYESVTSILDKVMPSDFLINKRGEMGNANYWAWLNELARMGTFAHIEVSNYLMTHTLDIDTLNDRYSQFFYENRYDYDVWHWHRVLTPKIIGLIRFIKEHNVTPIAIELPVFNDNFGYAGMLDLICEMDITDRIKTDEKHRNGKPVYLEVTSRKYALIDFKTGTGGFYTSYKAQLQMYAVALFQMFGSFEELHLMNVIPTEWKQGNLPNYKINATKFSVNHHKTNVGRIMSLWNAVKREFEAEDTYFEEEKHITIFKGSLNSQNTIQDCVIEQPLTEYIMNLEKISNYQKNMEN